MKRYSLAEIDSMRRALKTLMWPHWWHFSVVCGSQQWRDVSYTQPPSDAVVEDRLRTHMSNGTAANELEYAVAEMRQNEEIQQHASRAEYYVAKAIAEAKRSASVSKE